MGHRWDEAFWIDGEWISWEDVTSEDVVDHSHLSLLEYQAGSADKIPKADIALIPYFEALSSLRRTTSMTLKGTYRSTVT